MKYCCTNLQRQGSCYFEFQPGPYNNEFWSDQSVYLSGDIFDAFQLRALFKKHIPNFDYYGVTQVSAKYWKSVMLHSQNTPAQPVLHELNNWLEKPLVTAQTMTILGL